MSRMASRGTRATSRRMRPSGFRYASTVTLGGISCAVPAAGAATTRPSAHATATAMARPRPALAPRRPAPAMRSATGRDRVTNRRIRESRILVARTSLLRRAFRNRGAPPPETGMNGTGRLFPRALLAAVMAAASVLGVPASAQRGGGGTGASAGGGGTGVTPPASRGTASAQAKHAPRFTVDMLWPKPLPEHQLLGSAVGVAVDAQDHVFVVHCTDPFTGRTETGGDATPPIGECWGSAQPGIELDATGKFVKAWGGPGAGYDWPQVPAGIAIDSKGNVWIAGAGGLDGQVLVFTHDGQFVRQIGKAGLAPAAARGRGAAADTAYLGVSPGGRGGARGGDSGAGRGGGAAAPQGRGGRGGGRGGRGAAPSLPPNSMSTEMFGGATRIAFSPDGATAFIADGERNRRVVAVDVATGTIRKFWGAYGREPSDAPQGAYAPGASPGQFNGVACVETSKDGLLYVCDR